MDPVEPIMPLVYNSVVHDYYRELNVPEKQNRVAWETVAIFPLSIATIAISYFGIAWILDNIGRQGAIIVFGALGIALCYIGIRAIIYEVAQSKYVSASGSAFFTGIGLYFVYWALFAFS